jgi:hypothetical protein
MTTNPVPVPDPWIESPVDALTPQQRAMLDHQLTITHHTIEITAPAPTNPDDGSSNNGRFEVIVEHPLLERLNPDTNLRACPVHRAIRSQFPEPDPADAGTWFARIAPSNHALAGTWQFIRRPS